jgi:uncharacterized protein YxjI
VRFFVTQAISVIQTATEIVVVQRKELVELFGFETRNKYSIEANGVPFAYAAEQGKSGMDLLARYFLGHWRTFEIHFFDSARNLVFRALHPFRFFFQRLDVVAADGRLVGAVQQRFAVLSKRFDVLDANGAVLLTVSSPFWRPWTFAFERQGDEIARIEKKWAGLWKEAFFDADRFRILMPRQDLSLPERLLVLAAAIFVDLRYFEAKAR